MHTPPPSPRLFQIPISIFARAVSTVRINVSRRRRVQHVRAPTKTRAVIILFSYLATAKVLYTTTVLPRRLLFIVIHCGGVHCLAAFDAHSTPPPLPKVIKTVLIERRGKNIHPIRMYTSHSCLHKRVQVQRTTTTIYEYILLGLRLHNPHPLSTLHSQDMPWKIFNPLYSEGK